MPIKSIDDFFNTGNGIPYGGKLSKGRPNDSGTGEGEDLTHFRFVPVDEAPALGAAFRRVYGDEPSEILIYLVGDNPLEAFSYWLETYEQNRLTIRCDGETVQKSWNYNAGQYDYQPRVCPSKNGGACGCVRMARLHFTMPDIEQSTGKIYRYMLTTRSFNDIRHILDVLRMVKTRYCDRGYALSTIPFFMTREPEIIQVPTPDGNGMMDETHYLVKLKLAESFVSTVAIELNAAVKPEPITHMGESPAPATPAKHKHAGTYIPYLESMLDRFMARGYDINHFFAHYQTDADSFLRAYPYLSVVKDMVANWVLDNKIPVRLYGVDVKPHYKSNGERFKYIFDLGFTQVIMYTRELFREAGVVTDDSQWQVAGVETFDRPTFAYLERYSKNKLVFNHVTTGISPDVNVPAFFKA